MDYLLLATPFIENIGNDNFVENTINDDDKSKDCILSYVNKTGKTLNGEECKKYISTCFDKSLYNNKKIVTDICTECNIGKKEVDNKNALIICNNCGISEKYNEGNYCFDHTTQVEIVSQPFSYQRINHFKEWLSQLQAKETTVIPESVIDLILIELKKERITDSSLITSTKVKSYLKKVKLNKYNEHIPSIISKLTNSPPLNINTNFEKVLLELFQKIQAPFTKHCPPKRKNFLSYSYTLHKFCQLLGKNEYLIYFPLLKSREKLFEQEKIWKGICDDLDWKFIQSI